MPTPTAEQFFARKTPVPSGMTTAEWDRVRLQTRERAFFMACVVQAEILDVFRAATARVLSGELSEAEARREIRAGLARHGYAPRPGEEGTIKDLSTLRRQDIVIRTNAAMARNWAAYRKQWVARRAFPAKRMTRLQPRLEPRNWRARWQEAAAGLDDASAEHMLALLDSPVWERLSRFGAPYAPYDFNSGMGDIAVRRGEAEAVLGRELVARWLGGDRPGPGAQPDTEPVPVPLPPPPSPDTDGQPAPGPQPAPAPGSRPAPEPAPPPSAPVPDRPATPGIPPAPDPLPAPGSRPGAAPAPAPPPSAPGPSPDRAPAPAVVPVPPGKPAPGLNDTLRVTPDLATPEGRTALEEELDGLAVWDGDALVYTDPNGTRPYPAEEIPRIIGRPNKAGIPLKQEDALITWASGGAPALPPGSGRAACFADLVWRILPMTGNETLTLTSLFRTVEERAAALARLPQGGTWQPMTEFPFLAFAKAGAAPEPSPQAGYALTAEIVRHHSARDLTPAVEALAAGADAHGHHVLMPRGVLFRIEAVSVPDRPEAAITLTLIEEGGP